MPGYRIPDSYLEKLRDRNSVEDVISSYVALKRRGKNLVGLCPFHNEKTPSFTVYPETASYFCFGCGAGGDVVTFIRAIENLDYIEAVKFLAERSGMELPEDRREDTDSQLKKRILEANRAAARFFHEKLFSPEGAQQLEYLKKRGVSKQMITHFGLGAAPDSWHALTEHLQSLGFTRSELVAANLARITEKNGKKYCYDAFRAKVMYPVIDLRGNVVAFGGRVLDNSKPKYINTSDTPVYKKSNQLFALNFAKNGNNGKLILCEGYMDVIALHDAGFTNAVAGLGTALTPEQVSLISRYADEVSLCYDSDEAGQKAVRAALALFNNTGLKVRVIRLDGGKDPDEIIRTYGAERFAKLLEGADNDIEYKLLRAKEKYRTETDDGKLSYLKEAVSVLADLSPIERDIYAMRLSDELDVGKDAILSQVGNTVKQRARMKERTKLADAQKQFKEFEKSIDPERVKNLRAAKAEDIILISLLNNGSFYKKLKDELVPDLFFTPVNQRLLEVISARLKDDSSTDISYLAPLLTPDETGALARLFAGASAVSNTLRECEDCIKILKQEHASRQKTVPAEMSDNDFLGFFSSLKKDDDERQ